MHRLLFCLILAAATIAAEIEDYPQESSMWLLDPPVPMERSQRSPSLARQKEKSLGPGGHFPFYRGLGRK